MGRLTAAGETTPRRPKGTGHQAPPPIEEATLHTPTSTPTAVERFVDADDLICPGCGEPAVGVQPILWWISDGPAAQFSHPDWTALCRTAAGRIVEPVEVTR